MTYSVFLKRKATEPSGRKGKDLSLSLFLSLSCSYCFVWCLSPLDLPACSDTCLVCDFRERVERIGKTFFTSMKPQSEKEKKKWLTRVSLPSRPHAYPACRVCAACGACVD
mmetsp:Transcript_26916/g.52847  ORF Transcript_26916/g.52847 Transcript_26916/m.52847 type:complete len:111 (+) Transcript_26916:296-628(+)